MGDVYVREARVADGDALKEPYTAMHTVLREVRALSSCGSAWPSCSWCLLGLQA